MKKITGLELYKKVLEKDESILHKRYTNGKTIVKVDDDYKKLGKLGGNYLENTWGITSEHEDIHILNDSIPNIEGFFLSNWEEIQEPVDFFTVLNSGRYARVEHKEVKEILDFGHNEENEDWLELLEKLKNMHEGEFISLSDLLEVLSHYLVDTYLKKVILEGKWYHEAH